MRFGEQEGQEIGISHPMHLFEKRETIDCHAMFPACWKMMKSGPK
jgi:hypothetical protein